MNWRQWAYGAFFALPCFVASWEYPKTKDRLVLVLEGGPGFLMKGPSSHVSVLYQVDSDHILTDPFGNTTHVGWEAGWGVRGSAGVFANNKEGVEFLYSGLFNWTFHKAAMNTSTGVGVITSPYTTSQWVGAEKITWSTKTNFNSYELLFWYYITPRFEDFFSFAINVGGRAVTIQDRDLFFSFYTLTENPNQMKVTTDNWLGGGQLGLDFVCRPTSYLLWGVQLKGGGYADSIERSIYLTDFANTSVVANTRDKEATRASFIGEFLPFITLQNRWVYCKILGDCTYVGHISTTASSFQKIRKITQIQTTKKFVLAGGFVELGMVF